MMVKHFSVFTFCVAAFIVFQSSETTNAQCCNNSNQWLLNHSLRTGNRVVTPNPPYFAMHPPVYYHGIVSRAYGISPYAVPPGVVPVENQVAPQPKQVINPFFKRSAPQPEKVESQTVKESATVPEKKTAFKKSMRIVNPFYDKQLAKQ